MTQIDIAPTPTPSGLRKLLHVNWTIIVLICGTASIGFVALYSAAGGSVSPWASSQLTKFFVGLALMFFIAFTPTRMVKGAAVPLYIITTLLLVLTAFFGKTNMGATRWLDIRLFQLQPSELVKISLVLILAAYYDSLDIRNRSRPFWVAIPLILIALPVMLVFRQPDLGTSVLIAMTGSVVMFVAGVSWIYFLVATFCVFLTVGAVFLSKGTTWQLLKNYQFDRIEIFFDPERDPLGAGYHIIQSKIALGSGGLTGRGFLNGTQVQLDFLPERHTDFIFTVLGEELGLVWGVALLAFYGLIVAYCLMIAIQLKNRFCSLLVIGLSASFFLYCSLNLAMVTGLAPVVGVPLPLVSYGGSSMIVLLISFGLIQSAFIHRKS